MSANDTQQPTNPTVSTSRVAKWIEDPFASVIAGIVAPAFAVVFLLSVMAGLSSLLGA